MLILGLVAVTAGGGGYIIYRRRGRIGVWLMEKFLKDLVSRAIAHGFTEATELVATAVVPYMRTMLAPPAAGTTAVVDPALLRAVLHGAAVLLGGTAPSVDAMGQYTVQDMMTMMSSTANLTRKVLASYELDVPAADQERLLGAVAERVLAQVPAA